MAFDLAEKIIDMAQNLSIQEQKNREVKLQVSFLHYDHDQSKYVEDMYHFKIENINDQQVKITYKTLSWIFYKKNREAIDLAITILRQKINATLCKYKVPYLNDTRVDINILHNEEKVFTESINVLIPIEYEDLKYIHNYDCNNNLALKELQTLYLTYFKLCVACVPAVPEAVASASEASRAASPSASASPSPSLSPSSEAAV
jgi:hypothetical protein